MKKRTLTLAVALSMLPSVVLFGQTGVTSTQIGPAKLSWTLPGEYAGNRIVLHGLVHLSSAHYDLQSRLLTILLDQAKGGIAKATAEGDPAKGAQVVGSFDAPDQGQTYVITGDHAVYVPEVDRPSGGRIDFTGHVVVTLKSPKDLAGPGVMKVEKATVLTGAGVDYPKVDFGAGTLDFTPLPQGK